MWEKQDNNAFFALERIIWKGPVWETREIEHDSVVKARERELSHK